MEVGGLLRDDLSAHKARASFTEPDDLVFATARHGRPNPSNIRHGLLAPAIALANEALSKHGLAPIPTDVSPHSLRRPYISLRLEAGENPRAVMAQVGHTHPGLTLRIYAQVMKRRRPRRRRPRRLVDFPRFRGHVIYRTGGSPHRRP